MILGKRTRLWSEEDIDLVLTQDKGTEAIQSIVLKYARYLEYEEYYEARWREKAFSNMSQLKFLSLNGIVVPGHLNLPSSLKVLHLEYCCLETLFLENQQNELVEIKMRSCKISQLWHGKKFLGKLKYLRLSDSSRLEQIPDLSGVSALETLALKSCYDLTNIHPSVMHHKNLVVLNLSYCQRLKTLPDKLEMSSLKELILDGCRSFMELPEFGKCMKHLSELSLYGTAIRELPTSLGYLIGLTCLNLSGCKQLTCLPDSIHGLKSLTLLNISSCPNLRRLPYSLSSLPILRGLGLWNCFLTEGLFPRDFCYFTSLTYLDLSDSDFVRVPIIIHELPKLTCLWLNRCPNLEFLPELPSSIRVLEACDRVSQLQCVSQKQFEFCPLLRACYAFASASQDLGEVLQMLISGREIPSWFVHRQQGNCVSIPLAHNFPSDERMGLALCFLLRIPPYYSSYQRSLVVRNGKGFITQRELGVSGDLEQYPGSYLYILCLINDCCSNEFCQDNCFELLFEESPKNRVRILSSAARWVSKQDIEDLMKNQSEEQKEK